MPPNRSGRLFFILLSVVALLVIGRNLNRRYQTAALWNAIDAHDIAAVRSLINRGADLSAMQGTDSLLQRSILQLSSTAEEMPSISMDKPLLAAPPYLKSYLDAEAIACLLIQKQATLPSLQRVVSQGRETVAGDADVRYIKEVCQRGNVAVLRCLLDKGVKPTPEYIDSALNYAGWNSDAFFQGKQNNVNPAMDRARRQREEVTLQMVQLLREHGIQLTLAQCVALNDLAALKASLAAGTPADEHSANAKTPLALAVSKDNLEVVRILLAHGADVNGYSQFSESALYAATVNGDTRILTLLLARGAKVNQENYQSLLVAALVSKRPEAVRLLLAHRANPNYYRADQNSSLSTLTMAISIMPEVAPDLLKRGADVNANHGSPLQAALRNHRLALVQELLQRGAKVNPVPPSIKAAASIPISTRSQSISDSWQSLEFKEPEVKGKEQLSSAPSKPNYNSPLPFSPLANAAIYTPEVEALLVRAGATLGPDRQIILVALATCGRADLFAHFLKLGADVNGVDTDGETALTRAVLYAPSGVEVLLAYGANPNFVTKSQRTPLDFAASTGNIACVRLLLAHGAQVNLRPPRGHTPLYWAQRSGTTVVKVIDKAGRTLSVARGHDNTEIISLLQRAGARAE